MSPSDQFDGSGSTALAALEPEPSAVHTALPDDARRARPGRRLPLTLVVPGVLIAVAALSPAAYLLLRAGFSFSLLRDELSSPTTLPLIGNTLKLVVIVTLGTVILGVGAATLIARTTLPFPRVWTVLLTLPLGVPTFVGSYAWVAFSYRYFPESQLIFGLGGSAAILTLTLFPYVFLPTLTALRRLDPAQEEAARALGHGPVHAFCRITLPQLRTAIATGTLIISLHLLAEYGAVQMLNYETLTTAIVQRANLLGMPESARALAVVLALGALLLLGADRLLRGRVTPVRTGGGTPRPPMKWRLGASTPLWLALCAAVVVAALAIPLWVTASGIVDHLTGSGGDVDWDALWQALGNTAQWATAAAVIATACALPVSLLAVRYPGPVSTFVERSTWLAHALPGVIMALSLVYLSVRWLYPLYQTPSLLVIGYVVMFLPLAVGAQQVGIGQASVQFDEMSRALGKGPVQTFSRITLPLSLPAIGTGALLVGLDAGKELTTTLLMKPTGEHTLATALWATTDGEVLDFTAASPYGLALLLIGAVPAVLLARATLRN
ncbi:ABC transporter permease [Gordonia hydrophobica]|uniref:Iron ABC transporter permease n=1 Tax=Gordonia hydrophobica TaxID=40516 RepID=A0ABZ2U3J6_9ACTN|nr:iron ABC transporter permease [Gordonia hydrophobica]MBM7369080.1 iron(III) transport system permease protein [Gordonia hydrophobica]